MSNVPNDRGVTPPNSELAPEAVRCRQRAAETLERLPALPTAEELAEPILRGLYGLFEVDSCDRVDALITMLDAAEIDGTADVERLRAELEELLALVDRVARLVRVGIASLLPAGGSQPRREIDGMDRVIRALGRSADIEFVLSVNEVERVWS